MLARGQFVILLLVMTMTGCSLARPGSSAPESTPVRYPATWTPAPTETARPPTATPTLVVASRPLTVTLSAERLRKVPLSSYATIGAWADTTNLNKEYLHDVAQLVRLATGPQAFNLRHINPQIVALARLEATSVPQTVVNRARTQVRNYDGALLDNLPVESGDSLGSTATLLDSLRPTLGTRLLIASMGDVSSTVASSRWSELGAWLSRADGICLCTFLRSPNGSLQNFKDEVSWKKEVDTLARLSALNSIVLVASQFNLKNVEATAMQQWFEYALASFLVGTRGTRAYFSFQGTRADDLMTSNSLRAELGYPLGTYYQSYGMYARRYAHGMVLVNPGIYPREMPLARTYTTSQGLDLTRALLQPHTGLILLVPRE